MLIDADTQKTTADWVAERSEDQSLPQISCVQLTGALTYQLKDLATKSDDIVIDCGGGDAKAMRSALFATHVALLPFRPKRKDLKIALTMAEILDVAQAANSNLKIYSA